jgi:DNA-binding MarR family transcriptional regulator
VINPDQASLTTEDVQEIARLLSILIPGEHTVSGLIRKEDKVRRAAKPGLPFDRRVLVEAARRIYLRRRARERHLPGCMFGEPAWDMMLALYSTPDGGPRQYVSGLLQFANAPATKGLRYIAVLEQDGLIVRTPSPQDRRMVFLELSERGLQAMDNYMASVLQID